MALSLQDICLNYIASEAPTFKTEISCLSKKLLLPLCWHMQTEDQFFSFLSHWPITTFGFDLCVSSGCIRNIVDALSMSTQQVSLVAVFCNHIKSLHPKDASKLQRRHSRHLKHLIDLFNLKLQSILASSNRYYV